MNGDQMLPTGAVAHNTELDEAEKRKFALQVLGCLKDAKTSEELPEAIEALIRAYENFLKREGNSDIQNQIFCGRISDSVLQLQSKVTDKLKRLEEHGMLSSIVNVGMQVISKVPNMQAHIPSCLRGSVQPVHTQQGAIHIPPVGTQGPNPAAASSISQMVQHGSNPAEGSNTQQRQNPPWNNPQMANEIASVLEAAVNSPAMNLHLSNGEEVSPVFRLSMSIHTSLRDQLSDFQEVVRAAEKLFQITSRAFRFTFFSREFRLLCQVLAGIYESHDDEANVFLSLGGRREYFERLRSDPNLKELCKYLKRNVMTDTFYKLMSLSYACKLLGDYPPRYDNIGDKVFLKSVLMACTNYCLAMDSTDRTHHYTDKLQAGIYDMMEQHHVMLQFLKSAPDG